ncbi:hypothetical protein D3C73_1188880 [compost metagenome]
MACDPKLNDPQNPEWTEADFARARPASEVLPAEVMVAFGRTKGRGPKKPPTKVAANIRLSAEVLDHFKAGGAGWQTRIDEALKRALHAK